MTDGFNNPVVGGDGTLIIDTIKSTNYVPGGTGWAINKDGSFQLGSGGTIEGTVDIVSPDGSAVKIVPGGGGAVQFTPNTLAGVTELSDGSIKSNTSAFGSGHYSYVTVTTPSISDVHGTSNPANIEILTAISDGTAFPGFPAPNNLLEWSGDTSLNGILQVKGVVPGAVKKTLYSASATYTPTTGMKYALVQCVGGGGGGGGTVATGATTSACGGGGQAGAYAESLITAASIAAGGGTVTMTIGTAGAGSSGAGGSNGTATTFGAFISADGGGGAGAGAASAAIGVNPGASVVQSPTGGSVIEYQGEGGAPGLRLSTGGNQMIGGNGGSSVFGSGGFGPSNGVGGNATGFGAGGAGASAGLSQAAKAGGNGSGGCIIITEFF